jgi:hypothetical protein
MEIYLRVIWSIERRVVLTLLSLCVAGAGNIVLGRERDKRKTQENVSRKKELFLLESELKFLEGERE